MRTFTKLSVVTMFCCCASGSKLSSLPPSSTALVDQLDLALLEARLGAIKGELCNSASADANQNGAINIVDLFFVGRSIGCTTQQK
jgi:hypothetical protein